MQKNNSGCLTAAVTGFSRLFLLFAWIARPVAFDAAFGSWIWPCLGFLNPALHHADVPDPDHQWRHPHNFWDRLALAHPGGGG